MNFEQTILENKKSVNIIPEFRDYLEIGKHERRNGLGLVSI